MSGGASQRPERSLEIESGRWVRLPAPTVGASDEKVVELIYELLDAHHDAARLAEEGGELNERWRAHLAYVRDPQRVGREMITSFAKPEPVPSGPRFGVQRHFGFAVLDGGELPVSREAYSASSRSLLLSRDAAHRQSGMSARVTRPDRELAEVLLTSLRRQRCRHSFRPAERACAGAVAHMLRFSAIALCAGTRRFLVDCSKGTASCR